MAGVTAIGLIVVARGEGLTDSLVVVVALVGSVLGHELSHAVVAEREGMAVDAVRVSLLGGVTCYSGPDPGPEALRRIALAGPRTSLLGALGCLCILIAEAATGWHSVVGALAAWGIQTNLALGLVNLLPFGSLDGAALRAARRPRR